MGDAKSTTITLSTLGSCHAVKTAMSMTVISRLPKAMSQPLHRMSSTPPFHPHRLPAWVATTPLMLQAMPTPTRLQWARPVKPVMVPVKSSPLTRYTAQINLFLIPFLSKPAHFGPVFFYLPDPHKNE